MPDYKEPKITRTKFIVVKDKDVNEYGDIIFHDMADKEHKLGKKRVQMGGQIIPSRACEISYSEYMDKEYIAKVKLAEIPPQTQIQTQKIEQKVIPIHPLPLEKSPPLSREENIEKSVWIKELGEMIRSGTMDATRKDTTLFTDWYFKEMKRVLGIQSRLVEAVKKMGAKEIPEEDLPF